VRLANISYVFLIGLILDGVLGEGLIAKLYREMLFREPEICFAASKPQFTVEPPMPESEIAMSVESAYKAGGVENVIQLLGRPVLPVDPSQYFCW